MELRKAAIGLCLAFALSAVGAGAASAATNGTTAFICSAAAPVKTFSDADCSVGGGSSFGHVAFEGSKELKTTGGEVRLHSVISGINVELKATSAQGTGTFANSIAAGGEHFASGTGTSEYKNVTVVKPAGKGCVVKTGEIKTEKLKATTAGQGMGLKIEPNGSTPFAKFEIEGCGPTEVLNGVYEVTGSVVASVGGAKSVFTAAGTTAQNTLKLRGQKAGLDTTTTGSAEGAAVATTTVETP